MHNAPKPNIEDLPTKAQLRRSTLIAGIGAVFIGVCVYRPAEYGTDPTGVGNILGLTEMGEIKQQLAAEGELQVVSLEQGSAGLEAGREVELDLTLLRETSLGLQLFESLQPGLLLGGTGGR